MNFNKGDGASFCKTILSDTATYLPLPSTFAEKYLEAGNSNKPTLVLETTSAVKWSLQYIKVEHKYYFMDGWLQFVKDNGVKTGDILVFWLLSPPPNPMFQVFIYASDGCLKNPTSGSGRNTSPSMQADDHKLGDKKPSAIEIVSDDESSKNVHRTLIRFIRESYKRQLLLTKEFVDATGISGYSMLRLKNNAGKIWEVKLSKYRGRGSVDIPYITRGWFEFMKDNKIQVGDRCKFNHLKGNLVHFRVIKKKNDP